MIITSVLVIFSVKSSEGYDFIFDSMKNQLSVDCQNNARISSIKCELDACNKFGCQNCECTDSTTEKLCNTYWDGVCCYVGVFAKFCNFYDTIVLDVKAKSIENTFCTGYPRDSYKCNGSISIFGNFICQD
jgi:hypothetical protein